MAIAYTGNGVVQQFSGVSAGVTVTLPSPTTAGNLVVLSCSTNGLVTAAPITVTDSKSNTWTQLAGGLVEYSQNGIQMWYAVLAAGKAGSSHSFTFTSGSSIYKTPDVREFSGVDATTPHETDVHATAASGNPDPGSITTAAGNLLFGAASDLGPGTWGAGSGYSLLADKPSNADQPLATEYMLSSGSASHPSFTAASSTKWAAIGASFLAAAPDTTAPVVASAAVNSAGTSLVITCTEAGSPPVLPASGVAGFALTASGGAVTLSPVTASGTTITAGLSRTIDHLETLTLAYSPGNVTDSASSPNALASFSGTSVTNNSTQDLVAPTLSSPTVPTGGVTLTATLSVSGCTPSSSSGGFSLGGTAATVATWAISGTTLTLTLSGTVYSGETVTLTYAQAGASSPVANSTGTHLADFSAAAVTNNSTQTTPLTAGVVTFDSSGPGGGTAFVKLTATDASSGTPGYTYQWQRNTDGGSWSNLSGATTRTPLSDTTAVAGHLYGYRLVYTDSAGSPASATSAAVYAQVYTGGALGGGSGPGLGRSPFLGGM